MDRPGSLPTLDGIAFGLITPGTVVVAACLLLLAWYFVGTFWNRRRRQRYVRALAAALATLNPRPKIQWLGASAFHVVVANPPAPFARLTIIVTLAPREILLAWLVNRVRGRDDLVVIKGDLSRDPKREFDLFDPSTPSGRKGRSAAQVKRWTAVESNGAARLVWAYPPGQADPRGRWSPVVDTLPLRLHYLSIRRSSPHLHLSLAPRSGDLPDSLVASLVAVGEAALR